MRVFGALKTTLRDFAANTSIHGLRFVADKCSFKISTWERVLWLLIVSLGVVGSSFMVVLFWQRYLSNPTRSSTLTMFAPNLAIPISAVTICSINRFSKSKINNFTSKLNLNDKEEIENTVGTLPQLLGFTQPVSDVNLNELQRLEEVLKRNEINSVEDLVRRITPTCEEMLIKCRYKGNLMNCTEIFKESLTTDGFCCSANYFLKETRNELENDGKVYTSTFGSDMGLSFVVDPKTEDHSFSNFKLDGIKVIFHRSTDYPGIGTTHQFVATGKAAYFQVSGSRVVCSDEVKALSYQYRGCVFPQEIKLPNLAVNSNPNCQSECHAKQIWEYCNCVPYFYWFRQKDKAVCKITQIPCLIKFYEEIGSRLLNTCECFSQCEDFYYDYFFTSSNLQNGNYVLNNFMNNIQYQNLNKKIFVNVFFARDVQTIIRRDTVTSAIYLLSSFGGVFSLLLGCSFISCLEIIYYASLRLWLNIRRRNNKNKTTALEIKKIDVEIKPEKQVNAKKKEEKRRKNKTKTFIKVISKDDLMMPKTTYKLSYLD